MPGSSEVAVATVHSILIIVDIVGNSLVCLIIKKNRDMRIPINYLLVNLAVADILYAVFIVPDVFIKLTSTHPEGMTGAVLCKLLTGGAIAWMGAASSIVTLAAIAIERYYAVMYPLGNRGNFTKRKVKGIILGSWIFALIFNMPLFLFNNVTSNVCHPMRPEEWMRKALNWVWLVLIVLTLALMVGLYSRVVYTLWFKRNDDNQQRGVMKVRKRVTLMVVTVTAMFGICWLTDTIAHVVENNTSYRMDKVVFTVIHTVILFNSAVNPFVYALINTNFREKIKSLLCFTGCAVVCVNPVAVPQSIEISPVTTPQINTAGPCSNE